MDPRRLQELLERVREGAVSPEEAAKRLATLPYEDLGFAKVDHHRALRRGFPETVFGAGKTPEQVVAIVERIAARGQRGLVARAAAAGPAAFHGATVEGIYDGGVAGLHRLLDRAQAIRQADVVVVVAGMEGALPS